MLNRRQLIGTASAAAALSLPAMGQAQPRPARPAANAGSRKLGLALGAGSARGFAHIGVLQALEEAGISPSVVTGTSAGALVGVFYAAGFTPWQMQEVALKVRDLDVADLSTGNKRGMTSGAALQRLVNGLLKDQPIERMQRRYAAVATDIGSGEAVLIQKGEPGMAVRASCSVPGVFIPSMVNGRELVDGGLVSPLPIKAARQLGADVVIAVDVLNAPNNAPRAGLYEIIMQSFEVMTRALSKLEAQGADLLIHPETERYSSTDFSVRKEMIEAGYAAGQRALPALKRMGFGR